MTIVVWTPTCRPGIDVMCASIARQECDQEILWIVGDELLDDRPDRSDAWNYAPARPDLIFQPEQHDGMPFTVDRAHNEALDIARDWGADLFVFLCDYTWIPADGVQRFWNMAARHPGALLSGIAHTSVDPAADLIVDPDGAYTIFAEAYTDRPTTIGWRDIRVDRHFPGITEGRVEPQRCELNWAALTRDALHDTRVNFDERYDQFHSNDNVDFATRASILGHEIWVDYENVAIRLPRRTYWPSEHRFDDAQAAGKAFYDSNDIGHFITISRDTGIPDVGFFKKITGEWPGLTGSELRAMSARLDPFGELHLTITEDVDVDDLTFAAASAKFAAFRIDQLVNGGLYLAASRSGS